MAILVQTDAEAFQRVCQRLQDDVGRLIDASKSIAAAHGTAPFWALARTLFPVVEALGDLMYGSTSTADNLVKAIEELENTRQGYKGKAAIIALLHRHSLAHTDEMRVLKSGGKVVEWRLALGHPREHLKVESVTPTKAKLTFDLTAFYEDILALCQSNTTRNFGGQAASRYNAWTELDLDSKTKLTGTEKRAAKEASDLFGLWVDQKHAAGALAPQIPKDL